MNTHTHQFHEYIHKVYFRLTNETGEEDAKNGIGNFSAVTVAICVYMW